jgi:hypothetical protein
MEKTPGGQVSTVSLRQFHEVLATIISSPHLFFPVKGDALAGYDLTELERHRLRTMMADTGMATNCTLYRVNRLVPLQSTLPLTLQHLDSQAERELHAYWAAHPYAEPQYHTEAHRFASWLHRRSGDGTLSPGPYLDALAFELVASAMLSGILTDDDHEIVEFVSVDDAAPARGYPVLFSYEPADVLNPPDPPTRPRQLSTATRFIVTSRAGQLALLRWQ